jgi:hypothetical protein
MTVNLNGRRVYHVKGTHTDCTFLPLPRELWRPIEGKCGCAFCRANPNDGPFWDTLVSGKDAGPDGSGNHAWLCHAPEYRQPE